MRDTRPADRSTSILAPGARHHTRKAFPVLRLTVKTKILGLAGGLIVAMAALALVGISSLGSVNDQARATFKSVTSPLADLGLARAKANETRALLNNHILALTAEDLRTAEEGMAENDKIIAESLARVESTIRTPKGKATFAELQDLLATYKAERDKVVAIGVQAEGLSAEAAGPIIQRAARYNAENARPVFAEIAERFGSLFDQKVALGRADNEKIAAAYAAKRTLSIVLLALAVLIGVAAAWLMARQIRTGVGQMLTAAKGIAQGDIEQDVAIKTKDELGETGAAFAEMIEYLRETALAAEKIGAGDLTAELEPRSDRDVLRRAFVDMRSSLQDLIGELTSSAGTVSSASQQLTATSEEASKAVTEIATAIGDVAQGAETQVRRVGEVREAMLEAVNAVNESARSAEEASQVAERARDIAREGVTASEGAAGAMTEVQANSQDAARAIGDLASKSQQIGEFIVTITGIAEQTNLLALNAAIEAARAGEQGRGFAVVAEEVRKLAEESQQAANTISGLVSEIQSETARTVQVVEDGVRRTEEGSRTVAEAREAFDQIEGAVADMTARIESIAAAAQQITATTERVSEDITGVASVAESSSATAEQVSASTQETSASAEEISASAQELSSTAQLLEQLIGRFTVRA
jgi:methyl-accepting chemotaxis protein